LSSNSPSPRKFALNLRIPAWAAGAIVSVNGKRVSSPIVAGTFATIRREWKSGDRVELELPLAMHLEAINDKHPDVCGAFLWSTRSFRCQRFRAKRLPPTTSRGQENFRAALGGRIILRATGALPFTRHRKRALFRTYLKLS